MGFIWDSYGKRSEKYGIHMLFCIFFVGCWMLLTWHCLDKRRNLQRIPSGSSQDPADRGQTKEVSHDKSSAQHLTIISGCYILFIHKKQLWPAQKLGFQFLEHQWTNVKLVLSCAFRISFGVHFTHHDGGWNSFRGAGGSHLCVSYLWQLRVHHLQRPTSRI